MSFPGVVKIILQKKLNNGFFLKINPDWKKNKNIQIKSQIDDNAEYSINSLVVMFPWAKDVIDNCYFIELYASLVVYVCAI